MAHIDEATAAKLNELGDLLAAIAEVNGCRGIGISYLTGDASPFFSVMVHDRFQAFDGDREYRNGRSVSRVAALLDGALRKFHDANPDELTSARKAAEEARKRAEELAVRLAELEAA